MVACRHQVGTSGMRVEWDEVLGILKNNFSVKKRNYVFTFNKGTNYICSS